MIIILSDACWLSLSVTVKVMVKSVSTSTNGAINEATELFGPLKTISGDSDDQRYEIILPFGSDETEPSNV